MDKLRLIASFLIVAIHTYPFASINPTLDFIFTHVLARVGVPLFFMITGYFILLKAKDDKEVLIKYTLKILKMYALSIILYLPINFYMGKFSSINIVTILKDVFIDGTFYHLWYFPALILGIWIIYFIIKNMSESKALLTVLILFIIGLFGDSYYGLSESLKLTSAFYNIIFSVFNYTRNGLFFAPIFLYLGYIMKSKNLSLSKNKNIIFILLSLVLMVIEGLILHHYNIQKHDSMYIMLLPSMILTFNFALKYMKEDNKKLRNIATIIYIVHPLFIIIIRGFAKVVNLENIMTYNSIIHYLLVVISSVIFSILYEKVKNKILVKN